MNHVGNDSDSHVNVSRNYKDTLFRTLFKEPKALLELYNAVNGTSYADVDELEIITLENAIYMNMKNDVAFLIDCSMNLYEHQASVNPNMPLRNLFYVSKEYQMLTDKKSLYAAKPVKIPTPRFVVFYNGTSEQPERCQLNLSSLFATPVEDPSLELKVTQLNIGEGYNEVLKEKCPLLKEYVEYTERVRKYAKDRKLEDAVECAVKECIKEGILEDFLKKNRAEAISVSIFEYDEKLEMELFRQAEREIGVELGRVEAETLLQTLIAKMTENGEADKLSMLSDKTFYSEMRQKYKL